MRIHAETGTTFLHGHPRSGRGAEHLWRRRSDERRDGSSRSPIPRRSTAVRRRCSPRASSERDRFCRVRSSPARATARRSRWRHIRFSAADAVGETSEAAVQVLLRPEDLTVWPQGRDARRRRRDLRVLRLVLRAHDPHRDHRRPGTRRERAWLRRARRDRLARAGRHRLCEPGGDDAAGAPSRRRSPHRDALISGCAPCPATTGFVSSPIPLADTVTMSPGLQEPRRV